MATFTRVQVIQLIEEGQHVLCYNSLEAKVTLRNINDLHTSLGTVRFDTYLKLGLKKSVHQVEHYYNLDFYTLKGVRESVKE